MAAAAAPGRGPAEQALSLCHPVREERPFCAMGSAKVMAASDPDTATQLGGTPISTRRAWLWSLDQFLLSPMGLQASRPFWGTLSSLHPLCSLAVDTALLFPIWGGGEEGGAAQLHRVLVLTDMLAGRQAQLWVRVSPSPDGHWLPCSPSESAADRALALPQKILAQRLCSGDQRERRATSISLFYQTFGETESLKVRTPGSPRVMSMTHRGTLPQCLNFPAHTIGLRDLGGRWGEDYKVSGWGLGINGTYGRNCILV